MTCYRIFTQYKNFSDVIKLVKESFDEANISLPLGIYHGKTECSCIIEVLSSRSLRVEVVWFADKIKEMNQQESIIITQHEVEEIV